MSAIRLLVELRTAGLNVVEEHGWRTRGNKWAEGGKPLGVMQHHTSLPNPFPIKRLYGVRIKANMATHEDGTLYLIAYNACNYSSGPGMAAVLEDVRRNIAPTYNAPKFGTKGGNRYFWNYENSHPGDGSSIPQVQLDTIIESTRVVLNHFDLRANQVISHAEWTKRKIDPNWNGSNRTAIEQIREGVRGMAILSDEAQEWFQKTYEELMKLNPPTSESWGKAVVEHTRANPEENDDD